ncbi:PrsW family intramembrane metalloprotease [Halobacteria archaeon HArc-gm2]|nr:PrsW family intramembrane metalloprotease [Halobacteria archaeon HArc-gm2]
MDGRRLLRIARWEVTKNAGGVDRRTVVVMVLAIVGMGLVAALAVGGAGAGLDSGIYRVGVDQSSPYYAPADNDSTFATVPPSQPGIYRGEQELLFVSTALVDRSRTSKGYAAQSEFRDTVDGYNEQRMADEDNATAAYPVSVDLQYVEQDGVTESLATGDDGTADGSAGGSDGSGGGGGGGSAAGSGSGGTGTATTDQDAAGSLGGLGAGLTGGATSGTPADIQPPFPFESLVLAFLFVVPLNFVIQAYGSTMLSERLNRRGELLLVSPASRAEIIAGKTLPYFLGAVGVVTAITLALRFSGIAPSGSYVAVLAVLPLAALFLAATFCGAMFARSFKELTFVTVTITVSLTSYAFVPAIFTQINPIALISPLTIVVRDLQGQSISLLNFAFSVSPPTLTAAVLFGLGAGLYREEDMFTQRAIPLKVLDSLSGRIFSKWSALKLSALLLPFVFVAELAAVAMLFALQEISIPLVLLAVVVIEEIAKSLHLYAGFSSGRYSRSLRPALVVGALSGVGFFIAEKFVLIAQLADLQNVPTGEAAFLGSNVPPGVSPAIVAALLLVPLALHVVTASVSSLGARKGKRQYAVAVLAAMAIHFAYNYAVVSTLV